MMLFVLVVLSVLAPALSTDMSMCHNNHRTTPTMFARYMSDMNEQPHDEMINRMFSLCVHSKECRTLYNLDIEREDATAQELLMAFRYLVRGWATSETISSAISEACRTKTLDEFVNWFLLTNLLVRSHTSATVQCARNERFVFSVKTLTGMCVCADEHNCEENGHLASEGVTLTTVSLFSLSVVVGVYVILSIRKVLIGTETYKAVRDHCADGCPHRARFVAELGAE